MSKTVKIDFNIDEYVGELLSISEEPMTDKELAESIADIAMSQGYCEGEKFEAVVKALVPQMSYYR